MTENTFRGVMITLLLIITLKLLHVFDFLAGFIVKLFGLR
jgi:hypothetical protein